MAADSLVIRPGLFLMEDPWRQPPGTSPIRLHSSADGAIPRLGTQVAAFFDDEFLSVLFSGEDDHIVATHRAHDAPLFEEDVFEVFLAPEAPAVYFEMEVNPLGAVFDARIESPHGVRDSMRADRGWNCKGLFTAISNVQEESGSFSVHTLLRIPFRSLERNAPQDGETWRANFFRIDRHPIHGDEYTAWQPTRKSPPDFHVTEAFGRLVFERM